jgi:hypothetical protein
MSFIGRVFGIWYLVSCTEYCESCSIIVHQVQINWCHAILDEAHRISIDVRQGTVTRKSKRGALNISED